MTSQRLAKIGYAQSRMILLTLWCNSLYLFWKRRDKILLEDVVLAKSKFKQSRSWPVDKALATHIWVATHGFRNAALCTGFWFTKPSLREVIAAQLKMQKISFEVE